MRIEKEYFVVRQKACTETRNLSGSPTCSSATNANPQVHAPLHTALTCALSCKVYQAPRTQLHLLFMLSLKAFATFFLPSVYLPSNLIRGWGPFFPDLF